MTGELASLARWYAAWIWDGLRQIWAGLPGPWYVKILLILACQLIPGQLDEIALIALTAAWRKRQQRKTALKGA